MSIAHPVIAVTGSSGAGTTSVKRTFEHIFRRDGINAAYVEGDSFHRFDRDGMKNAITESERVGGKPVSHFGPEANLFEELAELFRCYGDEGTGKVRHYVHDDAEAMIYDQPPGTFTEWEDLQPGTDCLLYEGLHGGAVSPTANVAQHTDLLIGVVPIVNLEWIQKIHRDTKMRGYSLEAVTHTILRRMHDYVHFITPQFSRTHINFQRVPIVDTSNPFVARDIPTLDESLLVVRFRNPKGIPFPYLLSMINGAFMSRANCIVVPGGKMELAMQLILTPMVQQLLENRARGVRTFAEVFPSRV